MSNTHLGFFINYSDFLVSILRVIIDVHARRGLLRYEGGCEGKNNSIPTCSCFVPDVAQWEGLISLKGTATDMRVV